MSENPKQPTSGEDPIRPHTFDGIAEYDKKLPNWWLLTFYASIIFSIVYWFYHAQSGVPEADAERVTEEIAEIEAAKLAAASAVDDAALWKMSRAESFVKAGREVYLTNCASCHLASLKGKDESPLAIGPNLSDIRWIHGGKPLEISHTVTAGVAAKGMPAWGPILGPKRITEVVAFLLSHHQEGEPVEAVPSP